MVFESNPTAQKQTVAPVSTQGSGKNITKRVVLDTETKSTNIPDKVGGVILYNEGPADIALRMGGATGQDYFPIIFGAAPINIPLNDGVTIEVQSLGAAVLRCIFY